MKHLIYGIAIVVVLFISMSMADAEPIGAYNANVTQANIKQTICVSGWTKTIRPTASYTNKIKASQLPVGIDLSLYEEDHFIPLELGGNPTSINNLWAQPWKGSCNAHDKDRTENKLKKNVCSGKIQLKEAQYAIYDWKSTYKSLFGKGC